MQNVASESSFARGGRRGTDSTLRTETFQAFTSDLVRMADWLITLGIQTVAMESTGVYWVATFEVLESKGLDVILVNAREARAVPGRKQA